METFAPGKTQTQGRSAAPDTPRLDAYNGRSSLFPRPLQHAAQLVLELCVILTTPPPLTVVGIDDATTGTLSSLNLSANTV
uniref:Uncharacterized protein n=1 Tax=Oryza barthii TaxID=65489 RepID=A0A0D3EYK0_9ORYZ